MVSIKFGQSTTNGFRDLLSRSWLGTTQQVDSVAGVLKKVFGYDLYFTRGLTTVLA